MSTFGTAQDDGSSTIAACAVRAQRVLVAAGAPATHAEGVVACLARAERRGHPSHGFLRVEQYVAMIRAGDIVPTATTVAVHDGGACVALDAGFGFGQIAARQAIALGVERAQRHGIALVTLRRSGHIGRLADWAEQAAAAGCVAWLWLNTAGVPNILPFGGAEGRLSTNPIAAAFPTRPDPVVIDLTTSTVAEGKVKLAAAAGERIPPGWIVDREGRPTTDPGDLGAGGALLTMAGHKGFCLSLLVELMAGALSRGDANRPDVRPHNNMTAVLIRPDALGDADGIRAEAERFVAWVRATPPRDAARPVRVPGQGAGGESTLRPATLAALRRAEAAVGLVPA